MAEPSLIATAWGGSAPAALAGVLVGLSLAAPPGPMNSLIANHSAHHGWWPGARVGLAAPVADCVYLAVFGAGLGSLIDGPRTLRSLAAVGAALMALFAYQAWHATDGASSSRVGAKALLLAFTNPFQIGWWLTAGVVFVQGQGWSWVAGFLAGIFGWVLAFSALVAHGARRWQWFRPFVRAAATVLLCLFAAALAIFATGG